MAVAVLTLDELVVNAKAAVRSRFPTRSLHDESWLGKQANALAGLLWSLHDKVQQADWDATPQSRSSYNALSLWAYTLGLSDGAGGYGAHAATAAENLTVALTGTPLAVVWNGAGSSPQWVARDGETTFILTGAQSMGAGGTASVAMDASTAGTEGNLEAGDALTLSSSIPGVDSAATVSAGPTVLGTDAEGSGDLFTRLLYALQHRPKAITAPDLREIAEGVASIARAYVYPRRQGTGSADVVVFSAGTGTDRRPAVSVVSSVGVLLNEERTIAAESTNALRPVPSSGHAVVVVAVASTAYPWDWDSSVGGPWTIDQVTDTTHLRMSTVLPADFKAVIDGGGEARIQIKQTGAVLPVIHVCTDYSDGGGKTSVTLKVPYTAATEERTAVVAPTVGDSVFAGASFVFEIAGDVLGYVDDLGPSLASGYGDTVTDSWQDTIVLDQLRRVVLDAMDGSDVRFLKKTTSVTVDAGTADIQAADVTPATPPEYSILSSIVIKP